MDVDERARRKQLGAWYTPAGLVEHLLDEVLEPLLATRSAGEVVDVLDPACGDGRFLAAAGRRIDAAGCRPRLVGAELDRNALRAARTLLGAEAELLPGDALARRWGRRRFDLVVGNPPFLTPLDSAVGVRLGARSGRSVRRCRRRVPRPRRPPRPP